jgi:hypothetical protein
MKLNNILQELYPSAEIIDTSNDTKKCDIMIKRNNKPTKQPTKQPTEQPIEKPTKQPTKNKYY